MRKVSLGLIIIALIIGIYPVWAAAESEIITVDSLEYIYQGNPTSNTIVMFDIGDVLLEKTNVEENRIMDGDLALPDIVQTCFIFVIDG
jgi:hypothetical protein